MSQGGLNRTVWTFSVFQYLLRNELVAAASSAGVGGVVWVPLLSQLLTAPSWMPSVTAGAGATAAALASAIPPGG